MERNVIPRKFVEIIAECQVQGVCNVAGDKVRITRESSYGLVAENLRTGEKCYVFLEMLRNPQFYKIIEIKK